LAFTFLLRVCKSGISIGNLYFANVLSTDGLQPGLLYLCAVFNGALRGLVQGDDQRIQPVVIPGTVPAIDPGACSDFDPRTTPARR